MTLVKRSDKGEALTYNELDGNFTHLGGDGSYQFPATDGLENQVLTTDGNGQLSFTTISLDRIDGDLTGSVFADDSTILVDGVDGKIVGPVETSQIRTSEQTIALGFEAGLDAGLRSVAIGYKAGSISSQGITAIAIGNVAGNSNQGDDAVAVGDNAGYQNQGQAAVAMGAFAGRIDQGEDAIAIGDSAGRNNQGARSIAIGLGAGANNQHEHTIIISAQPAIAVLESEDSNRFYVKPVREVTGGTPPAGFSPMYYNPTTGEIIVVSP